MSGDSGGEGGGQDRGDAPDRRRRPLCPLSDPSQHRGGQWREEGFRGIDIHFDAHQDALPYGIGHAAHYGNFIRTLVLDNIVEGKHIIQVGMRGPTNSTSGLDFQREHGIKTFYMPEIRLDGFKAVAERILKELENLPDKLYISLDLDFYDSSVAIGTTAPEPGGVMPGDFFPLIRAMAIKKHVVGMDIVEVAPLLDNATKSTMLLASRSFYELLVGMALKKKGTTDPWYVHPDVRSGTGRGK